ncbi:hypothetical protein O181_101392 [Austropuccinia psidii MF-1]|uniref:DUF659 domain-containing protein n=1 Tax=Austropuccinia psidii MF-1 TaxID=1389203 RepID=A0A9Q3JH43_9BASI|nr:hypothetical protein [Austropuccinia psidii MF-1]
MMAPGVLFPSQYTSDSSISSLGRSFHQLTRGVLPPSLIGMDAQSDSSDDHYSTQDEYNLPHETASVSRDTRANQSLAQDCKRQRKRSDVYDYFEQLYCITGDNAANNVAMTTFLQEKFAGIGIRWPKTKRFAHCTCHVCNLVAKKFLAYMGQLNNEYYKFFDNYLGLKQCEVWI